MCKESVTVEELRKEVMADGVVTKEGVEMLWDKKDSQNYTTCEFDAFFAEAVMAWLLADGQIDEEEAQFLIDKINEDADIDDAEAQFLIDKDVDIDDAEAELLESINEWGLEGHEVPSILVEAFPDFFEED